MDTARRTRPNRAFVVSRIAARLPAVGLTAAMAAGLAGAGCNETAPPAATPGNQLGQKAAAPAAPG
ncbi:MAG TPA: hypothetical protein VF796_17520, partial [Humisphaera sp.]